MPKKESQADRAVRFINQLTHTSGKFAGMEFDLRPWQEHKIIRPLFKTRKDGLRQYRTCLLMLPRKNGKSEAAAALAIYFLLFDGELGAQVYSAAADKDQAALVFNVAAQMIRNDAVLSNACEIIDSQKRIVHRKSGSFYRAISAEAYCVAPDTLVEMRDGRRVTADSIRPGDVVIGWDGARLAPGTVRSVQAQPPRQRLRITTSRGRSITVSERHRFLAMRPGRRPQDQTHEYTWVQACDLSVGSRIRVALNAPQVDVTAMSTDEAWALGAWAGDGECGRFRFTSEDDEIVQRLRVYMESIGSSLASAFSTRQKHSDRPQPYPHEHQVVGVGRRRLSAGREWVRRHFGQEARSHTKRVPSAVWTGNHDTWAAFLAGWLDTDGCIPTRSRQVTWCSVSKALLRDGQALLARLGINACVNNSHTLTVNGQAQIRRLAEHLVPHLALSKKRERLQHRASEDTAMGFFAHESDRIVAIEALPPAVTISLEVDDIDTHVTDGLITHNSKHGFNASVVIYDELHAAPNRELWDVLSTSQGARQQPLMMAITTAGYDRHSILWELYSHAKKVQENPSLDPTFLPILFEAPIEADWTDEKVWHAANPALGDFRSLEEMRAACQRAQAIPAQENTFRRLYLNQWTEQASRWVSLAAWDACEAPVDRAALRGRRCYVGMDLSTTRDLTAIVAVFPDEAGGYDVLMECFVPGDNIAERVRVDRVPYDQWAKDGHLTATPGNVVDYEAVRRALNAWAEEFDVREVAYDPWNATDLVTRLKDQDGLVCVPMRQGFASLSAPTKSLERAILSKTLRHDGHPVLRWNLSNVVVESDPAGNLKMSKRATTERIDGAAALVNAVARMDVHADETSGGVTAWMI